MNLDYSGDTYDSLCYDHAFWSREETWWRKSRAEWASLVRRDPSDQWCVTCAARAAYYIGRCVRRLRAIEAELTRRDLPTPVWS